MVLQDIDKKVVNGGIKKMELNEEIKEIFDKFQGGYYYYSDAERNIEMAVETDYYENDARILLSDNDLKIHVSIELRNGNNHVVFSKENQYIEGNWELMASFIVNTVQQYIVDYKRYFEENGFDINNYDTEMCSVLSEVEENVAFIDGIDETDFIENGYLKKLDDMKRIVKEDVKLFWVD